MATIKDMNCAETTNIEEQTESIVEHGNEGYAKNIIQLPMGLLGFEDVKNYALLGSQEEAPFHWLRMVDDLSLAFLIIPPEIVVDNYEPNISPEDAASLGLENPQDALVLNIVTIHPNGEATVNLKGPIVLNRHTLVGKQVIPMNSTEYSLQHPLPMAGC